ncbi:hypothetical protein RhiirC2_802804 [Rhizophagus irregularis]|uniref:Uncharacterized protein n=1 Tax=Rhizophagus irregularis TaxID=588596 RepID=A0A2N1M0W8_9GLOM|nr:hypothetical protein RhiirC2_802804 [Rhizophagus irregularis]
MSGQPVRSPDPSGQIRSSNAGFFQSIAAYAHGIIHNWPSSTRAEIAAIHAALTVTPSLLTVTIHTDSQSTIDGLRLCATSSYSNSRL